jgi:acyl dehydratase
VNAGDTFGPSSWLEITQERIDGFADATGDHQWIHVDPEKAAQGPFGTTIAHGFLTLSLLVKFIDEVRPSSGDFRMGINYGVNRVRFPAPVPVGSKLRAHFKVLEVTEVEGGIQVVTEGTVEREGGEKPVCVAEMVSRHYH